MKLIKQNKYENLIALGLSFLVITSAVIGNNKVEKEKELIESQTEEFQEVERIKVDFVIRPKEEMLDEILELNINDNSLPYMSYKILEFKDSEGYYRIMPVTAKLNYELNSDGKIEDEYYDVYDVFYGIPLFKTHTFEKEDLEAYNSLFEKSRIISYDHFDKIEYFAYLHGASLEFITSVMPICEKQNFLSNLDVAIAYTYLVPESYRVNYEDLTNEKPMALK